LLNLAGELRKPHFDANLWWIDLRLLPYRLAVSLLVCGSVALLVFGFRSPRSDLWRAFGASAAGLLGLACVFNTVGFYALMAQGGISSHVPIPLSLFLSCALGLIVAVQIRQQSLIVRLRGLRGLVAPLAMCALCLCLFPLAQMFCFGKTDYRRPASVAVVLGARVYADGRPSDALADRVRTACQLYQQGLARKLLFSGGPGDGSVHETAAMKQMALRLGVKAGDILVDEAGVNTQATVRNTERLFAALNPQRILVVSHFYHLPRIKLAYQRNGWEVYTVPAKESYLLRQMPYNMAREVAALWVYYLRPLAG
jgi:vancomycin permeability regulator SanA